MALRKIVLQGDECLTKVCRPVTEFNQRLHTLIDDMKETLLDSGGVGLAAPQVGVLRRVVVVDVCDGSGLFELVNPVIVEQSGTQDDIEGCLSVSNLNGTVRRPLDITVRALDRNGQEKTYHAHGYLARAMCHEIDHLDGILFTDRATDLFRPDGK